MKIGAITVGQAPRIDITCDIMDLFPENLELLEAGGLDNFTLDEIQGMQPEEGDYILVSRLKDGTSVTFAEKHILPELQKHIDRLEENGCRLILVFCTGKFPPHLTTKNIPLVYPCDILERMVPLLTKKSSIICVSPSSLQIEQSQNKWKKYVDKVISLAASPYEDYESLERLAHRIKEEEGDLVVLDCMGYTKEMKNMIQEKSGKYVVLPRTLLARVVSEITN